MKTQKYIVEIEMPGGDYIGAGWLKDDLQSLFDRDEDAGRIKVIKVTELKKDIVQNADVPLMHIQV